MSNVISMAEHKAKKSDWVLEMEEMYRNYYRGEIEVTPVDPSKKVVAMRFVAEQEAMVEAKHIEPPTTRTLSEIEIRGALKAAKAEGVDTRGIKVIDVDPDCPY